MPEFAQQLASHLSSLPTGITAKTQLPATALPTPPLATDASMTSLRSGPIFPYSHGPETPITPANHQFPNQLYDMNHTPGVETPEFSRFFAMRRHDISPLPSSAGTHFNLDTPPQSAPPTQGNFMEQEIYQPFPRPPPLRHASNMYSRSSPVPEEGEMPESGEISFHVPFTSHDSHTPTIQFPVPTAPIAFNHVFQNVSELKKESSPYEEAMFSEVESGVPVFHGVPLGSHYENHSPQPVHDSAPNFVHLSTTASAGFNTTRQVDWKG